MRTSLAHLSPDAPGGVGAVMLSFTRKPQVDFDIRTPQAGGISVMNLPLVHGFLTTFLKDTLTDMMVLPRKMVIPMVPIDQDGLQRLSESNIQGIISIRVLEVVEAWNNVSVSKFAKALSIPSFASPLVRYYVRGELGEQIKKTSRAGYGSQHVNEVLHFHVHSREAECINLVARGKRILGDSYDVGSVNLWLQGLPPGVAQEHELALQHTNHTKSKLRARICWQPVLQEPSTSQGLLRISLYAAHDLRAMDLDGKSDPYFKFTVLGQPPQYSTTKYDTLEPRWEPVEVFDFFVRNSGMQQLDIEAFDEDNLLVSGARSVLRADGQGHASMGKCTVQIARIAGSLDTIDETLYLDAGVGGRLSVRLRWIPVQPAEV